MFDRLISHGLICRLGTVGTPLPGVRVRITKLDESAHSSQVLVEGSAKGSQELVKTEGPISGNLEVKGDSVFRQYWNKPEATAKEFTNDGWFKTGKRLWESHCIVIAIPNGILLKFQVTLYCTRMAYTAF